MKITLTQFEASEMLRQNFQQNVHPNVDVKTLDIIIENPPPGVSPFTDPDRGPEINLTAFADTVRSFSRLVPTPSQPSRKIQAIKALRETAKAQGVYVGLGDAKRFVEIFIP